MSFMSWIREKLGSSSQSPRMIEAMHATEEVAETARQLRKSIEPFKMADDPFIALWSHGYEALQEKRIYKGTQH